VHIAPARRLDHLRYNPRYIELRACKWFAAAGVWVSAIPKPALINTIAATTLNFISSPLGREHVSFVRLNRSHFYSGAQFSLAISLDFPLPPGALSARQFLPYPVAVLVPTLYRAQENQATARVGDSMTQRTFSLITGTLFLLIALVHTDRLLRGWQVSIGDMVVPLWVSWIGFAVAAYLAYEGFRLSRTRIPKKPRAQTSREGDAQ
jgi:hypothetical protein